MEVLPTATPLPDSGIIAVKIPAGYTYAMRKELFAAVKKAKEGSGSKAMLLMLPDDVELIHISEGELNKAGLQRIPREV